LDQTMSPAHALTAPLRCAVIGAGAGILAAHRPGLQLETCRVVAASDVNAELGQQRADELGCLFYTDHRAMLADVQPDVALVLTPHPFHAPIAIDCLEAGCHVLVEKPMAIQVAEADAMIDAATRAHRLLAVNFQQRCRPEVRAARDLIQQGQLGAIQSVSMTVAWTRTAAYFRRGSWRGTWTGEGGGVLMNQAVHNLDLLCHLIGSPARVVAWTRTQLHQIETEDTAQALLEWPDGAWGTLHVSTAEAGPAERLELVGTGGVLRVTQGGLFFQRSEPDMREFILQYPEPFATPSIQPVEVQLPSGDSGHLAIHRNLHDAILKGVPLVCDDVEGRMSLELCNAMIYSGATRREVTLPLDRGEYAAFLKGLQHSSKRGPDSHSACSPVRM